MCGDDLSSAWRAPRTIFPPARACAGIRVGNSETCGGGHPLPDNLLEWQPVDHVCVREKFIDNQIDN